MCKAIFVPYQLAPPLPVTMPALLERPKLSNAMARALHKHIMRERERKRQGVFETSDSAAKERITTIVMCLINMFMQ